MAYLLKRVRAIYRFVTKMERLLNGFFHRGIIISLFSFVNVMQFHARGSETHCLNDIKNKKIHSNI